MWIHSDPYCLFGYLYGREALVLDMNPGIGLAAEVLAGPEPEEVSQS